MFSEIMNPTKRDINSPPCFEDFGEHKELVANSFGFTHVIVSPYFRRRYTHYTKLNIPIGLASFLFCQDVGLNMGQCRYLVEGYITNINNSRYGRLELSKRILVLNIGDNNIRTTVKSMATRGNERSTFTTLMPLLLWHLDTYNNDILYLRIGHHVMNLDMVSCRALRRVRLAEGIFYVLRHYYHSKRRDRPRSMIKFTYLPNDMYYFVMSDSSPHHSCPIYNYILRISPD